MQMKKWLTLGLCVTLLGLTACQPQPKMSPMQKRQITTRVIDGSYANVFGAVMTTLQDHEYIVKQASKDTGLISAEVSRDSGFWTKFATSNNGNVSNAGTKVEVSTTLSQISNEATEVRMMIQEKVYNSSGGTTRSKQILDQKVYQNLFNDIKVEVKRREAFGR